VDCQCKTTQLLVQAGAGVKTLRTQTARCALSIGAHLAGLAALDPNDVWSVGPGLGLAHWDGTLWGELCKSDYYGDALGMGIALALSSGEILTLGTRDNGYVLIGSLSQDAGCAQLRVCVLFIVAPPAPTLHATAPATMAKPILSRACYEHPQPGGLKN
jgi:hypothetical protein